MTCIFVLLDSHLHIAAMTNKVLTTYTFYVKLVSALFKQLVKVLIYRTDFIISEGRQFAMLGTDFVQILLGHGVHAVVVAHHCLGIKGLNIREAEYHYVTHALVANHAVDGVFARNRTYSQRTVGLIQFFAVLLAARIGIFTVDACQTVITLFKSVIVRPCHAVSR